MDCILGIRGLSSERILGTDMKTSIVKNIVISGTNFWNPGDDFVRDGVICILRELFQGYSLNFLFYNFNQDFLPHDKFDGISNTVAKGDLDLYRDHVDMIVIAGLSAGKEIKDLYHWILTNNLQNRVYLIGAGYENSYVAENILQEPEASIFKSARVITGRTRKKPAFIDKHNLPYHYINCPAILSVPSEKAVPNGKRIEKIGFSIQLPHEAGVSNHCCARPIFDLAVSTLFDLSKKYQVEVIAHHKSEYFFFLKALQTHGIPVRFSSFYQEYHDIYRSYDLMITTRLHASLYANGHGIPGIIVNDTDRHTHCLEGFPHSVWVNSREALYCALDTFKTTDLGSISIEAGHFKRGLLKKYLTILKEPFGLSSSDQENQGYLRGLVLQSLAQVENKIRVLSLLQ